VVIFVRRCNSFKTSQQPCEHFLVVVMILPPSEIANVSHSSKRRSPVAIHHGIVYATREEKAKVAS